MTLNQKNIKEFYRKEKTNFIVDIFKCEEGSKISIKQVSPAQTKIIQIPADNSDKVDQIIDLVIMRIIIVHQMKANSN